MTWTDCPIIEQAPDRMSGAPVLRGTRLRPQDIIGNAEMGVAWIVDAFGVSAEDVHTVLDFWTAHWDELPLEHFSREWVEAHGADIDWTECEDVARSPMMLSGEPTIRGTNVRPVDLIGNREQGEAWLAASYDLPAEAIRSVLSYYDQHHRQSQLAHTV